MYVFRVSQPDPAIDTSRVEEIPAKEPKFHAVPLKSVLKKRGSGSGPGTPQNTPTQENRPLTLRQELHASFKLVPLSEFSEYGLQMLEYIDVEVFEKRSQLGLPKAPKLGFSVVFRSDSEVHLRGKDNRNTKNENPSYSREEIYL